MSTGAQKHPYHLVDPSPWPFIGSIAALLLALGGAWYMHPELFGTWWTDTLGLPVITKLIPGFALVLYTMYVWWRDVVREAEVQGDHTPVVQLGLRYGMALFIASEVMFFVAFFWAFFDGSLFAIGGPELKIPYLNVEEWQQYMRRAANGAQWPPKGVEVFDAWDLPFLNTLILLLSGVTVTWAHHALREGHRKEMLQALGITIFLGVCFTGLQATEYALAPFAFHSAFDDGQLTKGGIYSSTFFMATGFHGFHVFVGTVFLAVCWFRARAGHFKPNHHFGFEAAAWYWHFVDVVWLFLFFCIYIWGSAGAPIAVH